MSFLPSGLVMAEQYARVNAAQLDIYGEAATWTPAGGVATVIRVVRADPSELSAGGVLMMLFGTMAGSGFTQMPVKNDVFTLNSINYRAFDVQGPDAALGIWIHLTK